MGADVVSLYNALRRRAELEARLPTEEEAGTQEVSE